MREQIFFFALEMGIGLTDRFIVKFLFYVRHGLNEENSYSFSIVSCDKTQ